MQQDLFKKTIFFLCGNCIFIPQFDSQCGVSECTGTHKKPTNYRKLENREDRFKLYEERK